MWYPNPGEPFAPGKEPTEEEHPISQPNFLATLGFFPGIKKARVYSIPPRWLGTGVSKGQREKLGPVRSLFHWNGGLIFFGAPELRGASPKGGNPFPPHFFFSLWVKTGGQKGFAGILGSVWFPGLGV